MANIDVEDENILTSMFKDSFPESWNDNPEFVQYLSELSSYGVDKLAQEPDRLSEAKSQILQETQHLAFQHYKTFIQTAECSREIFEDFQIIEKHVGDMLHKLPDFSEECERVMKQAEDINASRRMNTLTLQRHTQLLEVLEMPQLMDTCVRNSYYEEALELAAHVKRLEKKHANIPVIGNIVSEVKNSAQLMLNQLIQQLRTNVQLPACLRVIGYLRRMDVFTEAELRIKFLQARDSWFQGILEAIPKEDPYVHITKTIEASRVHLFDIITQYRAIFSDEDPILSTNKEDSVNESALFHGWVVQKVSQFLTVLETNLHQGVGGRLDSILGQCMYFGLSFSRVGADFRGLLAPIFQRAALQGFKVALADSLQRFEANMQSYNLLAVTSTVGSLTYSTGTQSGQMFPPAILLDYHPLAAYCNDVLSAFNELRLCAPISLACDIAEVLQESLLQISRITLAYYRAEESTFDPREKDHFCQFCQVYATDLLPYLNKCLQQLFPPVTLAQILGVTLSDLNKMGSLGLVDILAVLDPISHLLPQKEDRISDQLDTNVGTITQSVQDSVTKDNQIESISLSKDTMKSEQASSTKIPGKSESEMDVTLNFTDSSKSSLGVMKDSAGPSDSDLLGEIKDTSVEESAPKVTFTAGDGDSEDNDDTSLTVPTENQDSSIGLTLDQVGKKDD
ncbi:conserved oligomeric Golgi complex subunit 8-like [Ylistrum balloti]|uniref:conserved oligomeric Golgi complex subunit 8-like n=1 Tax=Ylistrum balloti TaxID=509963 RepID=UPI0029059348|nr:conserved oligomeric Golgi complex subunit 8-like [Ylistrum balloti]